VDARIVALEAQLKIKIYSDAFENFFHQTGEYVFLIGMGKRAVTHSLTESLSITCVVLLFYNIIHAKQNPFSSVYER
jgi:hypothetical protein